MSASLFQFLIVFIIMAVMLGGLAYAVVDYFRSKRPKETQANIDVIHQVAEKITAQQKQLIDAVEFDSASSMPIHAVVAKIFGTTEFIETPIMTKTAIVYDFFKQLLGVADQAITSIQEIRATVDSGYSDEVVTVFRVKKDDQEVVMVIHNAVSDPKYWEAAKGSTVDVDGWASNDEIKIGKRITFFTKTADCDSQCQTDLYTTVKNVMRLAAVNRKMFRAAPGKGIIHTFLHHAEIGPYIAGIENELRSFEEKLLDMSYEAPLVRAEGKEYTPPMSKVVAPAVGMLGIGRHVALIGKPGVGKTILSEHIVSEMSKANPDLVVLKMEMNDVSFVAQATGRTVLTEFIKQQIAAKKKILIWLDEAQEIMNKSDLATLLQVMDGTSMQADVISVLACLNETSENIPPAFLSRIHTVIELKKLSKTKAENLLKHIVENTEATGIVRTAEFNGNEISLREVYKSVMPRNLAVELLDAWKPYKYNAPVPKTVRT